MSGKGHVGKEVVLPEWSARCRTWLKMDFLNSRLVVSSMTKAENDP